MNSKPNTTIVLPRLTENIGHLYDVYLLDLDGTVLLGNELIPGADKVIKILRNLNRRIVFISNNATSSPASYAKKLTLLGIPTTSADVVNPSMVMIDFLNDNIPEGRLLVIGEPELCDDLEENGFYITDSQSNVDAVIVSFDRSFSYQKLQAAFDAIRTGARFFATNNDMYRPIKNGGQPDAGAIIAAIEACTGTPCEVIVGKPSQHIINYVSSKVLKPSADCIIVGDRLETDIQMGINAFIDSALVLTGATSLKNAQTSEIEPVYMINSILGLLPDKILDDL